jgi:DNA-binding NtrC family response regulator
MVVLAHGREIGLEDIPTGMRDGSGDGRLLPVHVGPVLRAGEQAEGRELEFIVRSLVELKLQVEELRRRVDEDRVAISSALTGGGTVVPLGLVAPGGVEPPVSNMPSAGLTITPGMTMAEIERAAIEHALRETRGNRRKAAEILDIGERTLYRKLNEYGLLPGPQVADI